MNGLSKGCVVKTSAAAAIIAFTLCPSAEAAAPGFYYAAPQLTLHAEAPPFAGTHNYGTENPSFRWGWFGAEHFYPTNNSHKEYMGDVMRWSRWRRY